MVFCGVCAKECNEGATVKCSGKCDSVFHLHCVKNEADGKITRSMKDWKCSACKSKSSTHSSVKSTSSATADPLTKDFLIQVMEQFKKDMFAEINTFRGEMNDLTTSVQHVSDQLDSSNKLMEEIKRKFADLQKENMSLKAKNEELTKNVVDLQERMRSIEQYSRITNIEISGLPVTREENICDLVADVGAVLEVEMQRSDVAAAHRVPSYRSDREQAVVVQFTSRSMKEQWIIKSRKKKNLTARDVNGNFPAGKRVYVNDHLSPENKLFLARLKKKGRELGYAYIWCRDGKFFMRKAEGEPVRRINTYAELDNLK